VRAENVVTSTKVNDIATSQKKTVKALQENVNKSKKEVGPAKTKPVGIEKTTTSTKPKRSTKIY